MLREEVVPCWESLRPVPQVTIDAGDGRVLRRTLGGNTCLYVCTPDGLVADAFPGVYTPEDFLAEVRPVLDLLQNTPPESLDAQLAARHGLGALRPLPERAAFVSLSKAVVESPILGASGLAARGPAAAPGGTGAGLVDASKLPLATHQIPLVVGVAEPPTAGARGAAYVALDSRRNLESVRPDVHLLLSSFPVRPTPAALRDPVFKGLLHLDLDDPFLGLGDAGVPGTAAPR